MATTGIAADMGMKAMGRSEELARRIRDAAGEWDDKELPVQAVVSEMRDTIENQAMEIQSLRTALAQHSEPGRIPEGYCLVPAEPTEEMINAGESLGYDVGAYEHYEAMLAAAPAPDADERGVSDG